MATLSLSKEPTCSLLILVIATVAGVFGYINILGGVDAATPTTSTTWCVTRSDASTQALQTALDYACGAGADCIPIQSNGLCYLPNTIQAHSSYAFNSYYQRKAMAPGSCDFSGTATIAQTDPSYGSCVYPSSLSTAGGTTTTPTSTSTGIPSAPTMPTTTIPIGGVDGTNGLTPGMTPPIPDDNSKTTSLASVIPTILMTVSFMLVILITLRPM